jgi:hypothetical protein
MVLLWMQIANSFNESAGTRWNNPRSPSVRLVARDPKQPATLMAGAVFIVASRNPANFSLCFSA